MIRLIVLALALAGCGVVENHDAGTPCSATENKFDHYCTADGEITLCLSVADGGSQWAAQPCTRCAKDRELPCSSTGVCSCE